MTTADADPAHDVTDLGLADEGVRRIEWAEREMPVLRLIRERFERERPLAGLRIGACLHVTTETANLMRTLKAGGAEVVLAASNPLSTKDDVAAALVAEYGIGIFARRGEDRDTYYAHLNAVADTQPQLTMDDGCDLVSPAPQRRDRTRSRRCSPARRRRRPASSASGRWPPTAPWASRSSPSTRPRPSTSSTTATGPARARSTGSCGRRTSSSPAARSSWPATAGWARGSPSRMSGPRRPRRGRRGRPGPRARGADGRLRGHDRRPRPRAWGELFITATGNVNVFRREHFVAMRDGAIMANSGHFDAELDLVALRALAEGHVREVRDNVQEFDLGGEEAQPHRRGSSGQPRARPRATRPRSWT